MDSLGISAGSIIEVKSKESAVAIAWPSDEEDQRIDIIRIDGQTRKNAGVTLNEFVSVRRINSRIAPSLYLFIFKHLRAAPNHMTVRPHPGEPAVSVDEQARG